MFWIAVIIIAVIMIKDSTGPGFRSEARDIHKTLHFDMMENDIRRGFKNK